MIKKVLVVEDNEDILIALTEMLEIYGGYNVTALREGNDVIPILKSLQPDLILMDIMLGGCNGGLICREIKEGLGSEKTKIILMSASTKYTLARSLDFHQDDFIEKPFSMASLLQRLKGHFE